MKSGGYYSNTYGKQRASSADEADYMNYGSRNKLILDEPRISMNGFYEPNEDVFSDKRALVNEDRANRSKNYKDDYDSIRREKDYPVQRNGMHMKFDIVHKDPLYDDNHIYHLKQGDSMRQNGRYNDQNNNIYQNYEGRSANFMIEDPDLLNRIPGYEIQVVLLHSYPLSTEQFENNKLEEALNKYITYGQKKIKDRRDMTRPNKNDVSFIMRFYPECIALLDPLNKTLVRKHAVNQIMIYGYSQKKYDPIFCYIHRDKENATGWLYHTFGASNLVSQYFKKICIEKEMNQIEKKSKDINEKFGYKASNAVDVRYTSEDDYGDYRNQRSPSLKYSSNEALYKRPLSEANRQSRYAFRPIEGEYERGRPERSSSYDLTSGFDVNPAQERNRNRYTASFHDDGNRAGGYDKQRFKPIYENEIYTSSKKAIPAITYDYPKNDRREISYQANTDPRFKPMYENDTYVSRKQAIPAITYEPIKNEQRGLVQQAYNDPRTIKINGGTVDRRTVNPYQIKTNTTEVIHCRYVGSLTCNNISATGDANRIIERILSLYPQMKWLDAKVIINSTLFGVKQLNNVIIYQTRITNLGYLGPFINNKKIAMVGAIKDGRMECHVFYCEPNCQNLLKFLSSALNQQNDVSTSYSQKYVGFDY